MPTGNNHQQVNQEAINLSKIGMIIALMRSVAYSAKISKLNKSVSDEISKLMKGM